MDRKAFLLSTLKKQVLHLKNQLNQIQKQKHYPHSKSRNKSTSRFSSNSYDSSQFDRGVKKFPEKYQHQNLTEMIQERSITQRRNTISKYRKAENDKTKQNFSQNKQNQLIPRKNSPNPLTGSGYNIMKKGIKTKFESKPAKTERATNKRHYSFSLY